MSLFLVADGAFGQIEARRKRHTYKFDPVLWAKEVAGVHLWSRQAEIAMSVAVNKNTAVKAGHGVGKSFLAALLICWWVDTRYPNCFVASTAPSTAQIGAIVWREIHLLRAKIEQRFKEGLVDHKLPGYVTSDHIWKTEQGVIVGFGRKPPDQKTDDAFQGLHASEGVLAIGDEAVGLREEMIDALGNITTTKNDRRLIICNPTNPASYVGQLFKTRPSNWQYFTIAVIHNPNFTDEKDTTPQAVLEALSDESFLDSKREEYGEGSPRWTSRIMGEFAWDMGFTLIRAEDIAKGLDCDIVPSPEGRPVFGVDVSRSKRGDKNSIYKWQDGHLRYVDSWNEPDAMRTADRIHSLALSHGVSDIRIDGVGLGGPIADRVRELAAGKYEVYEILGNDPSPDRSRWFNFRAWGWWNFQDRLSQGLIDIDTEDIDLQEQLLSVELKKRSSGTDNILLESKEDMAKRGVSSPDLGDAAVYASIDLSPWTGNPYNRLPLGAVLSEDRADVAPMDDFQAAIRGPGMPMYW